MSVQVSSKMNMLTHVVQGIIPRVYHSHLPQLTVHSQLTWPFHAHSTIHYLLSVYCWRNQELVLYVENAQPWLHLLEFLICPTISVSFLDYSLYSKDSLMSVRRLVEKVHITYKNESFSLAHISSSTHLRDVHDSFHRARIHIQDRLCLVQNYV